MDEEKLSETLLGCPRATLLKAITVCAKGITFDEADWLLSGRLVGEEQSIAHLEHAFREWLVEDNECLIMHNSRGTHIVDEDDHGVAAHEHHLTAQALAVVEIEEQVRGGGR